MYKKYFFIALIFLTFSADRISKILVEKNLAQYESIEVLDDFLRFTHVKNKGIAFGLFSEFNPFLRKVLIFLFQIVALALIISYYLKSEKKLALAIGFGLILGGAFGNIFDRIIYSEVIDFIDIGVGRFRWPIFNIADTGIVIGICLILLDSIISKKIARSKDKV